MKKLALIIALFGVGYLVQAQQGPATKPVTPTATPAKGGVATANTNNHLTNATPIEKSDKKAECSSDEKKQCGTKKSCCSSKKAEAKKD